MFSAIVPTLQRAPQMPLLLETYLEHPLVDEVIVVNNAQKELNGPRKHGKLRILNQRRNLFVNPAWNLGAREAHGEFLIVTNDDILFDPRVIDAAARLLRWPVGIIGPHPGAFSRQDRRPWFLPAYTRSSGFGTLMFLRASNYVMIPDGLLIWCGDDYLFHRQEHRNFYLMGSRIDTKMSTTSADPTFTKMKQDDLRCYHENHLIDSYDRRFAVESRVWSAGLALKRMGWRS